MKNNSVSEGRYKRTVLLKESAYIAEIESSNLHINKYNFNGLFQSLSES